jgi:hypothetical protein
MTTARAALAIAALLHLATILGVALVLATEHVLW